jgi:small subunit ribosomal protein S13
MFFSFDSFTPFYLAFKNSNKALVFILDHYFSVGPRRAALICSLFGFSTFTRGSELSEVDWLEIKEFIEVNYGLKSFIQREELRNIDMYKKLRTYRGLCHVLQLPVRGQRTHTNAQTQKNKRINRKKMSYRKKN